MTAAVPRPPVVPLRPLGAAELLDGAVRLVRRHARAAYSVSVPFAVAQSALAAAFVLGAGSTLTQLGVLGGLAIAGGFGTIVTGLLTPVFAGDLLGQQLSARDALRRVGRRWWPLTVLAIASSVTESVALGTVVGGIWLWGSWAVVAPAMVTEGTGVRRSFGRSVELVRGMFWRTWGLRALGWLLTYVLSFLVRLPFLALALVLSDLNPLDAARSSSGVYVAVAAVGTLLSVALLSPVTSAVEVLLYLDLRMRREGLDLALALPPEPQAVPRQHPVTAW